MIQDFFKKNNVKQLNWPANSPDFNMTENLCFIIDNKLLQLSINNLDDLWKTIENGWSEISPDPLEKLFQPMAKRVRHGIDFKDFLCNYE